MAQHKYPKLLKDLGFNLLLAQIEMIRKGKIVISTTDKQAEIALEDSASEEVDDAKETTSRCKSEAGD